MKAAGDDEVSGSLWGGFGKYWSLDFCEVLLVQKGSDELGYLGTKTDILGHARTAKIKIAIFVSDLFINFVAIGIYG